MSNNLKTRGSIITVTSGDTIDTDQYRDVSTYSPKAGATDGFILDINTRYGGAEDKFKVSTPSSRKQDKIEKINQKLRQLGS